MTESIAIQDMYDEPAAHCYGCGRLNDAGYQIKTRSQGTTTLTEFVPEPFHTAYVDSTYGGLIASIIDCHSTGSAAILAMQAEGGTIGSDPAPRFVTAHLELDYLAPTPLAPMRLVGRAMLDKGAPSDLADIEPGSIRKVIVETELWVDDQVTAKGSAVLVRISSE